MCEGLHKDSGARCRSDVPWNGLLHDRVWYDDGGPGMAWNLAKLAEGTYAWWCSEPTICLRQHHWMDGDRDRVDFVIWNVTHGTFRSLAMLLLLVYSPCSCLSSHRRITSSGHTLRYLTHKSLASAKPWFGTSLYLSVLCPSPILNISLVNEDHD